MESKRLEYQLQEINLATQNTGPYGIAVSDKGEVWFTQYKANQIGCIKADGTIMEYSLPTPDAKVLCLIVSSDGEVWFTENAANKIGRITKEGKNGRVSIASPEFSSLRDCRGTQ